MKAFKTIREVQEYEEVTKIICDRCGKNIGPDDIVEMQEFLEISFTGGYGSVFGDQSIVECDICQECLMELIGDFCRIDGKNKKEREDA